MGAVGSVGERPLSAASPRDTRSYKALTLKSSAGSPRVRVGGPRGSRTEASIPQRLITARPAAGPAECPPKASGHLPCLWPVHSAVISLILLHKTP